MYPNDPNPTPVAPTPSPINQPTPPAGPDNQPSCMNVVEPEKKRFLSGKILWVLIGAAVALVLVIIIAVVVNNSRQAALKEISALSDKIGYLRSIIVYDGFNSINNSNTVKVTAETKLVTMSHQNELSEIYDLGDKISDIIDRSPAAADLDDAKARGNLDNTYIETLRNQLLLVCSQLEILYDSAKDDEQKDILNRAYKDFEELASRLPTQDN
jgi:hypothetical protein